MPPPVSCPDHLPSSMTMGFLRPMIGWAVYLWTESHHSPQKVHLLSGKGVVNMAAGLEHSLALTESGDLYSFGDNLRWDAGAHAAWMHRFLHNFNPLPFPPCMSIFWREPLNFDTENMCLCSMYRALWSVVSESSRIPGGMILFRPYCVPSPGARKAQGLQMLLRSMMQAELTDGQVLPSFALFFHSRNTDAGTTIIEREREKGL